MKKTLVALAVLAASGASFAQVTITGGYAAGIKQSVTGATTAAGKDTSTSGVGIDTAEVKFNASEDLGGGLKVAVNMGIGSITRKAGITGIDSGISLTSSLGTLSYSLAEGSDFISRTLGQSGGVGMDGKITSGLSPAGDGLSFDTKAGPISIGLDYSEVDNSLGAGAEGEASVTGQRQYQVRLGYSAGALKTTARYATYDSKGGNASSDNRVRLAAAYDFGVASVGAAYSRLALIVGTRIDTGVSVSAPVTSTLTLGANWASRQRDNAGGVAAADGTSNGYGLSAAYALSKRTSVSFTHASWTANTSSAAPSANKSSETALLLAHSF